VKRRPSAPKLYGTLFEISAMRQQVRELGVDPSDYAAARFLSRLGEVEAQAMRLLDRLETRRGVVTH
jgi:hypothetical protein